MVIDKDFGYLRCLNYGLHAVHTAQVVVVEGEDELGISYYIAGHHLAVAEGHIIDALGNER